jgi:RNA polymerase sigma-70 factor (ECF subfamily)
MVFGTAVRLLGRVAEAEDVSQTVFLRAFQRFDDLRSSPAAPGWLKKVTTNLCLNHLSRYRARWQFFSEIDDSRGSPTSSFESRLAAPPADQSGDQDTTRVDALEAALRSLPDHQRVPLVLFHFESQSYEDIASTLGVSIGKVKTDIHRGRLALKRALEPPAMLKHANGR